MFDNKIYICTIEAVDTQYMGIVINEYGESEVVIYKMDKV